MIDDLARQLRGIGMPVCNQAADALEAKEREIARQAQEIADLRADDQATLSRIHQAQDIEQENERLRAEIESLKRDAERYRWLRATTNWATCKGERIAVSNQPEAWDAAIDAAMSQQERA